MSTAARSSGSATFSLYLSDVPQDRAGWASPAVDPATGNIYMFTVAAELLAFAPDGKLLWDRSLPEEYGAITTHGGRTTSPIIEGDKVILNTLIQNWGPDLGRPGNRYFAFDKRTGQTIWVSSPQARHYDTNYSTPIVADVNGTRLLIVGGTDGVFHALQVNTGKPVWSLEVSKRAILNSVLFRDNTVYLTHGEENIDTTEMGMVAAIDATGSGPLTGTAIKWVTRGFLPTFSSPVMDGERLYSRGQQRDSRRVRSEDRQGALDEDARHAAEGIAGARRRQALRRHRERQVLHPAADGDRRRGARRGPDRHGGRSRADRRVAGDRRRPHLRDDDAAADAAGSRPDICTRSARGAHGRRRRGAAGGRAGSVDRAPSRRCRCFRTKRCSIPARSRRSR